MQRIALLWCIAFASLSSATRVRAQHTDPAQLISYTRQAKTQLKRRTVLDYFHLLPWVGLGGNYQETQAQKRAMLQPHNDSIIDISHDYMLVHPDSSPAEQIGVFRTRNGADLLAISMPDFQSDYNFFALYRLQNGKLRDVTSQMLPVPTRTDRFLYELPRVGTTIHVFRFDLEAQSRRHAFDLQWRGGHFVKVL